MDCLPGEKRTRVGHCRWVAINGNLTVLAYTPTEHYAGRPTNLQLATSGNFTVVKRWSGRIFCLLSFLSFTDAK